MYIQLPQQTIHLALPAEHWLSPLFSVPVTAENAEELGYVPVQAYYTQRVQAALDAKAKTRNYDGILSACSYASVPNIFQAESIAFIEWRSAVWGWLYHEFSKVMTGQRALPSIDELLAELPTLESFEAT